MGQKQRTFTRDRFRETFEESSMDTEEAFETNYVPKRCIFKDVDRGINIKDEHPRVLQLFNYKN